MQYVWWKWFSKWGLWTRDTADTQALPRSCLVRNAEVGAQQSMSSDVLSPDEDWEPLLYDVRGEGINISKLQSCHLCRKNKGKCRWSNKNKVMKKWCVSQNSYVQNAKKAKRFLCRYLQSPICEVRHTRPRTHKIQTWNWAQKHAGLLANLRRSQGSLSATFRMFPVHSASLLKCILLGQWDGTADRACLWHKHWNFSSVLRASIEVKGEN